MTKQIFFRMEVSADEKANILNKLKHEYGGDSFSNVCREIWGLPTKNRSESMKENKNAKKNFGKSAKVLLDKLTDNGAKNDSHAIEKRFMELLNRFDDFESFERLLNDFKKLFKLHNVFFNVETLNNDIERFFDNDDANVKREWSRGFWGESE